MANKRILVSCGQEPDKEIRLGRDIINVIGNHKGMGGFFSQHVHSPADLNSAVFGALKTCDGFFAVMHKRGGITYRNYPVTHRSSVWIQQEIAIIAYRSFLQGCHVPIRLYQEKGILLEGLMNTSIVNPILFERDEEVLEGVSKWLTGPDFEEHPVLARRESLFRRRTQDLTEHHWLILELIAAHTPEPGADADYHEVNKDFREIIREQGEGDQALDDRFHTARAALVEKGLIAQITDHAGEKTRFRIPKQWWDLVLEDLRNQGRMQ